MCNHKTSCAYVNKTKKIIDGGKINFQLNHICCIASKNHKAKIFWLKPNLLTNIDHL